SQTAIIRSQIPRVDAQDMIKNGILQKWQSQWTNIDTALRRIKPHIGRWKFGRLSRRDEVVLARLRLGHTRASHSYLFSRSAPPQCTNCQTQLTVQHILVECQKYAKQRHINNIEANLPDILKNCSVKENKLLQFF